MLCLRQHGLHSMRHLCNWHVCLHQLHNRLPATVHQLCSWDHGQHNQQLCVHRVPERHLRRQGQPGHCLPHLPSRKVFQSSGHQLHQLLLWLLFVEQQVLLLPHLSTQHVLSRGTECHILHHVSLWQARLPWLIILPGMHSIDLHIRRRVPVLVHTVHLHLGAATQHHLRPLPHRRRRRWWIRHGRWWRRRRLLLLRTGPAAPHGHVQSFSRPDKWQLFVPDRSIILRDRSRRCVRRLACQLFRMRFTRRMRRRRNWLQQLSSGIKNICRRHEWVSFSIKQWHMPLQWWQWLRSCFTFDQPRWWRRRHRRQWHLIKWRRSAPLQHPRYRASLWRRGRRHAEWQGWQHHCKRNKCDNKGWW